jgi:hypothetical protein
MWGPSPGADVGQQGRARLQLGLLRGEVREAARRRAHVVVQPLELVRQQRRLQHSSWRRRRRTRHKWETGLCV